MTVESQVGKDALNEWLEHPVTAWVTEALQSRADEAIKNRADVLIHGDAARTQEIRCHLTGAADELNLIIGVMNELWLEDEECPLNYLRLGVDDE